MGQNRFGLLEGYMTTADTSKELRVAESTLKRWRGQGFGPATCRIGGRVYYRHADVVRWIEQQMNHDRTG